MQWRSKRARTTRLASFGPSVGFSSLFFVFWILIIVFILYTACRLQNSRTKIEMEGSYDVKGPERRQTRRLALFFFSAEWKAGWKRWMVPGRRSGDGGLDSSPWYFYFFFSYFTDIYLQIDYAYGHQCHTWTTTGARDDASWAPGTLCLWNGKQGGSNEGYKDHDQGMGDSRRRSSRVPAIFFSYFTTSTSMRQTTISRRGPRRNTSRAAVSFFFLSLHHYYIINKDFLQK
jgi:hypothetical protein